MYSRTHLDDVFNSREILIFSLKERLLHPRKAAEGGFLVEMMGLIGAGNNPMVGMTVACAVAIEESQK